MYVLKFGGSSVANSKCILNVLNILSKRKQEKILLVLSACQDITNKLEKIAEQVLQNNDEVCKTICNEIKQIHLDIIQETITNNLNNNYIIQANNAVIDLCAELENLLVGVSLLHELTPQVMDKIYSFGERLSTTVFYYIALEKGINIKWEDARKFIRTDDNFLCANVLEEPVKIQCKTIKDNFNNYDVIVTQGFIGSDLLNRTTTLGRGGSDLTAAIFGMALQAECIEIWTDVNGILSADPKLIPEAISIKEMQYSEIKELSFWGAKVLHPKTILPAIKNNIKVKVLNSLNPNNEGTIIKAEITAENTEVHSIISKQNCSFVEFNIDETIKYIDVLELVLKYIDEKKIKLLYSTYSNQSIKLIIDNNKINELELNSLLNSLSNNKNINNRIIVKNNVDIICIAGQNFMSNINHFNDIIYNINECFYDDTEFLGMYIISSSATLFIIKTEQINSIIKNIHKRLFNYN